MVEQIYAGPQGSFVPKSFSLSRWFADLTDLGFIVVQMDGMGTVNRSKAFHDVCWKNFKDAGFPDRILWHRAVARKYPYYDVSRVGITGGSAGGQNSAGALLFHGDLYKVAVSACGCHDNRMDKASWNEQWMGYPVGPQYAASSNIDNAHRLTGKLLLIVGEMDTNVPTESTYRLCDALIKAGKDFDYLMVPGSGHGMGGAYGRRRLLDFFARHLQRVEPPDRNAPTKVAEAPEKKDLPLHMEADPPAKTKEKEPEPLDLAAPIAKPVNEALAVNAAAEVRRSFAGMYSPLYQAAYLVGAMQFRSLRKELVDTGKMTERDFHDALVKANRIPVELIRADLTRRKLTRDYKASWKFGGVPATKAAAP